MPLSPLQLSNLLTAGRAAKSVAPLTTPPVPAILTICQWALESGWGAHQPGNNCFGIKSAPGTTGAAQTTDEFIGGKMVTEQQVFQTFTTLADCFIRHSQILLNAHDGKGVYYYLPALQQYAKDGNLQALFVGVAQHYATDPNYASKLHTLSAMPEVIKAVA